MERREESEKAATGAQGGATETIYALTGSDRRIRYVGRTSRLSKRIASHLNPASALRSVRDWVVECRARDEKIACEALSIVPKVDAPEWERFFIQLHSGPLLLNARQPEFQARSMGADLLLEWMGKRGLRQVQLVAALRPHLGRSVDQGTVSRWVRGVCVPGPRELLALTSLCGIRTGAWFQALDGFSAQEKA